MKNDGRYRETALHKYEDALNEILKAPVLDDKFGHKIAARIRVLHAQPSNTKTISSTVIVTPHEYINRRHLAHPIGRHRT